MRRAWMHRKWRQPVRRCQRIIPRTPDPLCVLKAFHEDILKVVG
jgi:hypothetical protein